MLNTHAKQMIARWVERLGWMTSQTVASISKAPAAPSPDPQKVPQIEADIAAVRQAVERQFADMRKTVEQLAVGQDGMVREINKLHAADEEILAKIPVPPPPPLGRRNCSQARFVFR
jgi:hypothetical protein